MSFLHRTSLPLEARGTKPCAIPQKTLVRPPTARSPRDSLPPLNAMNSSGINADFANSACSALRRKGGFARQPTRTAIVAHGSASDSPIPRHLDRDLETPLPGFSRIDKALEDIAQGKFLLVLDDESRENEGDLIIAASKVTTESMAYLVEYSSGVVCVAMEGKDLDRLKLPLMVRSEENEDTMYTAFAITCDLRDGITTGISASDRAKTIVRMANPDAKPAEFRRPGHIFPLRYRAGGVLVRPGHTEAAVDLSRLAGLPPVGVLCEVVNKADGSMARTPDLLKMSEEHGVKCITIADLVNYRLRHDVLVELTGTTLMHTKHGDMQVHTFKSTVDGTEHMAIIAGDVNGKAGVLTHLHPGSSIPDALRPAGCPSLEEAVQQIASKGTGVVLAFGSTASQGKDTSVSVGPSVLECCSGAQMLRECGVASVQLLAGDAGLLETLGHVGLDASLATASQPSQHVNGHVNGAHGVASKDGVLMGMRS